MISYFVTLPNLSCETVNEMILATVRALLGIIIALGEMYEAIGSPPDHSAHWCLWIKTAPAIVFIHVGVPSV
jgi:hypothetical protein